MNANTLFRIAFRYSPPEVQEELMAIKKLEDVERDLEREKCSRMRHIEELLQKPVAGMKNQEITTPSMADDYREKQEGF